MAHSDAAPFSVVDGIEDLVDLVRGLLAHPPASLRILPERLQGAPLRSPIAFTSMAAG